MILNVLVIVRPSAHGPH